jgi:hypothetical protein
MDAPLRVLASAILFRAVLRAWPERPSAEQKMRIHQRAEEAAWALPKGMLLLVEGRDVEDGVPEAAEWTSLVATLVAEGLNTPGT